MPRTTQSRNIAYSPLGMKVAVTDADLGGWTWTRNPARRKPRRCATRKDRSRDSNTTPSDVSRSARPPDGTFELDLGLDRDKEEHRPARESLRSRLFRDLHLRQHRPAGDPDYRLRRQLPLRLHLQRARAARHDHVSVGGCRKPLRIRHDYDDGRVSRIGNADAPGEYFWRQNAQDAAGHVLDETLGASLRVVSGYSPVEGDLEYRQSGTGGGAAIQDLAYRLGRAQETLDSRRDLSSGAVRGVPLRHAGPPRGIAQERHGQPLARLRRDRKHPAPVGRVQWHGALLRLSRDRASTRSSRTARRPTTTTPTGT